MVLSSFAVLYTVYREPVYSNIGCYTGGHTVYAVPIGDKLVVRPFYEYGDIYSNMHCVPSSATVWPPLTLLFFILSAVYTVRKILADFKVFD